MSEHRNSHADAVMSGRPQADYHVVPGPERTDGVGMALRRAFTHCARARPEDGQEAFADLLGKLDQATRPVRG
jgi:hypothetical protein